MKTIEQMNELEFAFFFQKIREKILVDPLEYFVKAPGLINFTPTPGQTVVLKNVFGQRLDSGEVYDIYVESFVDNKFDLEYREFSETELYKFFTGFDYKYTGKKFNRINMLAGRRGKSTLASIIALFSAIKINWKPFLRKTPVATIAILSHSVDFSQEILNILQGMVDDSDLLSKLRDPQRKNTQSTFHLKIPFIKPNQEIEYSCIAIKVGAASKKTTRGRAVCTLIADEICYWNLDSASAEPDTEVLKAIRPALLQFGEHGTLIKLSSPATKAGVMYDEWNRRTELKDEYIQLKAPSWMLNNILPKEEFINEYNLDPDGFKTEFRADFVDSISNFILPEYVDLCTLKGVQFLPPSNDRNTSYFAAIDAAFKSDRFSFALVGINEHRLSMYVLKLWEGTKNKPIEAFEVAEYIRNVTKQYGINQVAADQYAFQPMKEIFQKYGVTLVENTFSLTYKKKIYFSLKRLIHSQNIDLLDVPQLLKEIKELQVEQTGTGQIRITHPNRAHAHDDAADALAIAAHMALEKGNIGGVLSSEIASLSNSVVKTDYYGKAFLAPAPDMLGAFKGFEKAEDNSGEWVRDPKTNQWVRISELEDEDDIENSTGGNFSF